MATDSSKAKTPATASQPKARAAKHIPVMEVSLSDETPATERAIQKLQRAIVDGLEDVKAQDIRVFNTAHLSPLFERVVLASGTSNRQTKALAASVRDSVREAGFPKPRIEGEENGEWIIVDCGSAVVHVMQPAIRQYYTLEDIWGDKPVRMRIGAAAVKAAAEKRVSRTAARTAAKKEAQAEAAADAVVETVKKSVRKSAAKAEAAEAPAKTSKPRTRKADAVTVVVGQTVTKKAVKPKQAE